jgi:hypothetical protein
MGVFQGRGPTVGAQSKRVLSDRVETVDVETVDVADKRNSHAPSCRPLFDICRDSRWTAHGMCLLLWSALS